MGPVRLAIASLARGLVGVNGFGCLNVILLVVVKGLPSAFTQRRGASWLAYAIGGADPLQANCVGGYGAVKRHFKIPAGNRFSKNPAGAVKLALVARALNRCGRLVWMNRDLAAQMGAIAIEDKDVFTVGALWILRDLRLA